MVAALDDLESAFRAALEPPEELNPAEWAERHRVLTRRQSSRPGRWRNAEAPYLVGIMLMCVRAGIEVLTILKAAQIGVSEAMRCVIGYLAHLHPDPVLLVLPDKETGEGIVKHRLIPLLEDTPVLRNLLTGRAHDLSKGEVLLDNGFTLRLGWSGSASSLASHPARYVVNDERSKFQDGGKEADPESLAAERTSTYADSKVINLSTPAEDPDPTAEGFESSPLKLYVFVPCPHCGRYQRLVWDRVRWEPSREQEPDKDRRAAAIEAAGSAWYECEGCSQRILDRHRRRMVNAGYWGTGDEGESAWKLWVDGREEGKLPRVKHVGMQVSALYSLAAKHSFVSLAGQFVRAEGDAKRLQAFKNSKLGEVFRHQVQAARPSSFSLKCRPDAETGFVPIAAGRVARWASRLLMTVDTQKDHFYVVIRAWGHRMRSHRVLHRKVATFDDLHHLFHYAWFHYEEDAYPPLKCHMLAIDSGGGKMGLDASRTDAVYRFCLSDPTFLRPLKGDPALERSGQAWDLGNVNIDNRQLKMLLRVNSQYFNDVLAAAIDGTVMTVEPETGEATEAPQWMLNDEDDPEYNAHLANMHKILQRRGRGHREAWDAKTGGARVDYRMCEVYQFALAHGLGNCAMLPPESELAAQHKAALAGVAETPRPTFNPMGYRGKW